MRLCQVVQTFTCFVMPGHMATTYARAAMLAQLRLAQVLFTCIRESAPASWSGAVRDYYSVIILFTIISKALAFLQCLTCYTAFGVLLYYLYRHQWPRAHHVVGS